MTLLMLRIPSGVFGLPARWHHYSVGPIKKVIKSPDSFRRGPRPAGPTALPEVSPTPGPSRTLRSRVVHLPNAGSSSAPVPQGDNFRCPHCPREFTTKSGLGLHRKRAHPVIFNEEIDIVRSKRVWNEEELRLMAREEALALQHDVKFVNQHLLTKIPGRTLDSIKGARRGAEYKRLVAAALQDLVAVSSESDELGSPDRPVPLSPIASTPPGSSQPSPVSVTSPSSPAAWNQMYGDVFNAVRCLIPQARVIRGWHSECLVLIASDLLAGEQIQGRIGGWLGDVFPLEGAPPRPQRPQRPHYATSPRKKVRRRREYARIQRMFKSNMSRAVKEILDASNFENAVPNVRLMTEHWGPFVTEESVQVPPMSSPPPRQELAFVWHPVSCEEVAASNLPLQSAPGLDGVSVRQWRAVPATIKALLFNTVLAAGGFPMSMLASRTVFVPKKTDSANPADFRPISVMSVVVRHLHKILALRLRDAKIVDLRQRCFDDGCGDNVAVLASLLLEARRRLKELHVASLDVAKAFDSVSHCAIANVVAQKGLPVGFREYVSHLYANSSTVFEVNGCRSELFKIGRGVRQGDPLSPVLFCLCIDAALRVTSPDIGFQLGECRINSVAYADDILLFAGTQWGMQSMLREVEGEAKSMGLYFNPGKCSVLSIIPAGKQKKVKICSTPKFQLRNGAFLPQITSSAEWRYLGVDFQPEGPKKVGVELGPYLDRITRAPLKPQQRLKILRCFLIPRLYHTLVLGNVTLGKLRALDLQVRAAVRRWLRLPKDTSNAFFHASTRSGGLGIPALAFSIPGLMLHRLRGLAQSTSPQVRAVANSSWVTRRQQWAARALRRDGFALNTHYLREKWWAHRLHESVDGMELRECSGSSLSTWWVDAGSLSIPGRDYVQHVHVRINALPTRIRTSRGTRRTTLPVSCRAGCRVTETAAHVIQGCFRTHGGRILRHNAVCRTLAAGLRNVGWTVMEEPSFVSIEGKRKPDLLCKRDGLVHVVDAQVVSGATSLDQAHERKLRYYSDNASLVENISRSSRVRVEDIKFSSCTLSWRGIWSIKSADWLLAMGLSRGVLRGITTRVLQGSHTNWNRWNRLTAIRPAGGERERQGIG